MTLEAALLILETALLIFTIILLVYSIKEQRQRDALLSEVARATKILTRQEYFLTVSDTMAEAKEEVIGYITGRLPSGDDTKRTRDIVHNIETLAKKGVSIKYILPKFPDRLHIGHIYTKAGADVRYGGCVIITEIRFMVTDRKTVLMGIPESIGEKEATKKGFRIPSEGLASILREYFQSCWENGTSYEGYVMEVIKQSGVTPKLLAGEVRIEEEEILRILGTTGK